MEQMGSYVNSHIAKKRPAHYLLSYEELERNRHGPIQGGMGRFAAGLRCNPPAPGDELLRKTKLPFLGKNPGGIRMSHRALFQEFTDPWGM